MSRHQLLRASIIVSLLIFFIIPARPGVAPAQGPAIVVDIYDTICDGRTYPHNGNFYSKSGDYTVVLTAADGRDSVVTLHLAVLDNVTAEVADTICRGQSYAFNGTALTAGGDYTARLATTHGCDSVVTLHLTVADNVTAEVADTICEGESYAFNGTVCTTAGDYTVHLESRMGCDSAVTLHLAVLSRSASSVSASLCNGSYFYNGNTYHDVGDYTITLRNAAGCDSVVTLHLGTLAGDVSARICRGQSYEFNGNSYTEAGTYPVRLYTDEGCDSTVTLHLAVLTDISTHLYDTVCAGQSYDFHGTALTATGVYVDSLRSAEGCDSVVTLHLAVLADIATELHRTICRGSSYDFDGRACTEAGDYTRQYTSRHGCDSVVTLHLAILETSSTDLTDTICRGRSVVFNGQTLTREGDYTARLANAVGCDSVVTLHLAVVGSDVAVEANETICAGQSYAFNGTALTREGDYTATFTGAEGCDSVVTLHLAVADTSAADVYDHICNGRPYQFNGNTYTAAGNYTVRLTNAAGCDSVVTLHLTLPNEDIYDTICVGQSYTFNGQSYSAAGQYQATLTNPDGCDSVVTLHLAVSDHKEEELHDTICDGRTYLFGQRILTVAGDYQATFTGPNGCDSVVTLHLAVIHDAVTHVYDSICAGESYTINGHSYTAAGDYTEHLTSHLGCDSTVEVHLTTLEASAYEYSDTICSNQSYRFNGRSLTRAGTYTATLTNAVGCDSVVTLNLAVLLASSSVVDDTICTPPYLFNGQSLGTPGTYYARLTNAVGCDSVVAIRLAARRGDAYDTICPGTTYTFHGQSYSQAGTYTAVVQTAAGCDSTVTLHLTVRRRVATDLYDTICDGATFHHLNHYYSAAGSYVDTLRTVHGCDSIVTLHLAVLPNPEVTVYDTICDGTAYHFNGQQLTAAGTYVSQLQTAAGCDSTVTLNLAVLSNSRADVYDTICDGRTCHFLGNAYSAAGDYTTRLANAVGCDSLVTLHLAVLLNSFHDVYDTICYGTTYSFNGRTYRRPGSYVARLANAVGCDSTVTLHLAVRDSIYSDHRALICEGQSYTFNGTAYTEAGDYTVHLVSALGCDSTATLHLAVAPNYDIQIDDTICRDQFYNLNGTALNSPGEYVARLKSVDGCDSIVTLHLAVLDFYGVFADAYDTICDGEVYASNGNYYGLEGVYTVALTSHVGCDSTVTLYLHVLDNSVAEVYDTICDGTTYAFNGLSCTATGDYPVHLVNAVGCDSLVTLHLHVLSNSVADVYDTICDGRSVVFNGTTCSEAGDYPAHLVNAVGCDSLVTLHLTVLANTEGELYDTICDGRSYSFNGTVCTTAGDYVAMLTNAVGCDSTATLHLYVADNYAIDLYDTICYGHRVVFNGITCDSTGDFVAALTTRHGCDSIVTLHLLERDPVLFTYSVVNEAILPASGSITLVGLQPGWSYAINGETGGPTDGLVAGTYAITVVDEAGCDTTVQVTVGRDCLAARILDSPVFCADDLAARAACVVTNGRADTYNIRYSQAAQAQGFQDQYGLALDTAAGIVITPPAGNDINPRFPRPDQYSATVEFNDAVCGPIPADLRFSILYSSTVMEQKWNDVIAVLNERYNDPYNGGYRFEAFQWYLNGQPIAGQTGSYLYIGRDGSTFDYGAQPQYQVELWREGEAYGILTCPLTPVPHTEGTHITLCSGCAMLLHPGQELELSNIDAPGRAMLYDVPGRMLSARPITREDHTIRLPDVPGVYLLVVTSGSSSQTFRLLVE